MTKAIEKAIKNRREQAYARFLAVHAMKHTMTRVELARKLGISEASVIGYLRYQNFEEFSDYNKRKVLDREAKAATQTPINVVSEVVEPEISFVDKLNALEYQVRELNKKLTALDHKVHSGVR
jgi:DNA-binding MurR/RpiR family transcriptional regulator